MAFCPRTIDMECKYLVIPKPQGRDRVWYLNVKTSCGPLWLGICSLERMTFWRRFALESWPSHTFQGIHFCLHHIWWIDHQTSIGCLICRVGYNSSSWPCRRKDRCHQCTFCTLLCLASSFHQCHAQPIFHPSQYWNCQHIFPIAVPKAISFYLMP